MKLIQQIPSSWAVLQRQWTSNRYPTINQSIIFEKLNQLQSENLLRVTYAITG